MEGFLCKKKICYRCRLWDLSGRAVLVELDTGNEIATAVKEYPHGVMDEYLPGGEVKLEHDWACNIHRIILMYFAQTIPAVLKESGVSPEDVIGVGVDFTSCTMLPIDKLGKPLCLIKIRIQSSCICEVMETSCSTG